MNTHQTINIKDYLAEDPEILQQLFDIIDQEKRVLLVANPGTGKTKFSVELMKRQKKARHRFVYATFLTAIPKQLGDDFNFDLICSYENLEWRTRKNNHKSANNYLQKDDLVIGTTLHQLNLYADELTDNDVIVIDEAHQLVQLSQITTIHLLREELLKTEAKLLLMTGTPYEEECEWLNLKKVDVRENNPRVDNLIYIPLTKELREITSIQDLTANLIHFHLNNVRDKQTKKMLIYNNQSKVDNATLSRTVFEKAGYIIDDINADKKNTDGYQYILKNQKIRPKAHGIVTTSSLKEGISIKNKNIEKVLILGPMTLKDEKQIVKRIRRKEPIDVYRIYNEPGEDLIEDVEYEIEFIDWLKTVCKNRPERFTKILEKHARCSYYHDKKGLFTNTGIIDKKVKSIDKVKLLHVMEELNAKKSILDDYLNRQNPYNDIKTKNGHEYLKEKYDIILSGNKGLGTFGASFISQRIRVVEESYNRLHDLLLNLFGQSKYFDIVFKLLKNELIGYFDNGKLLRNISTRTVTSITNTTYTNPIITKHLPPEDQDDEDIKDIMALAIDELSSSYRNEMKAAIEILHFLAKNAKQKKDVLPILSEAIDPSKLVWHAERFKLSLRLDRLQKARERSRTKTKSKKKASIKQYLNYKNKEDKDIAKVAKVIDAILSQHKDYGVIHIELLKQFIANNLGAEQYYTSLDLEKSKTIKLIIYALGIVDEKISYKRSSINSVKFDKLWKAIGKKGTPKNTTSIGKVFALKPCSPAQLIQYYRKKQKSGSGFVM